MMDRRLAQDLDRWLTTDPEERYRMAHPIDDSPEKREDRAKERHGVDRRYDALFAASRTGLPQTGGPYKSIERYMGRTPVTSHELRFMRQRIEGESQQTRLHDIALNAIGMLERAVQAEERRR